MVTTGMACISTQNRLHIADAVVGDVGYAEYVSVEKAPMIDGVIDEVWDLGSSMIETSYSPHDTFASIDVMWNETGLYFLAMVIDYSLNDSDLCNLWVSEEYITGDSKYKDKSYLEVTGSYYLCLNSNGANALYNEENVLDMTGKYTVATTKSDDGYILEVYVPLTSKKTLLNGNSIGFDVSIDDYLSVGTSIDDRESYVNWCGDGAYWSNPNCLGRVVLVDFDFSNGSPVMEEDSGENTDNSSEIQSSLTQDNHDISENSESTNPNNKASNGCKSSVFVTSVALAIVLFTISVFWECKKEL